jgi:hypothetical protein
MDMILPHTLFVPYGIAEIRRRKYTFHPTVIDWCKANMRGKWFVHRKNDPSQCRDANFKIDRPVTAAASFENQQDAALFKIVWC